MQPQLVRHGEVILYPIQSLPENVKLEKEAPSIIVAHSETGHHHVMQVADKLQTIRLYTKDGVSYLDVPCEAQLVHEKTGKEVHTPHTIAPYFYEIRIKKEYNYYTGALQKVRD